MKAKKKLSVLLICLAAVLCLGCAFTVAACESSGDDEDLFEYTSILTYGTDYADAIHSYAVSAVKEDRETVTIPAEHDGLPVTSIWESCFAGCTSLKKVVIPDSVNYIGFHAFDGCTNLKTVVMPDSIEFVGQYSFYNCRSLKKITVPEGVDRIQEYAFAGCDSLKKVDIPSTASIYINAFEGCTSLKKVTLKEGVTQVFNYAFKDCWSLKKITLPSTLTTLSSYACSGCKSLKKVIYYGNSLSWNNLLGSTSNDELRNADVKFKK